MKRFLGALRNFFLPPADAKVFTRVLPLAVVALFMVTGFAVTNYAWEETNLPSFCGGTCHTMPPEYVSYQQSAHTNVSCEDCHMGRDRLPVMVQRKVKYSWQTGTAMLFNTYHYPIYAKNMAPAREACENCHKPETFAMDKLVEIPHYAEDEANTLTTTYLAVHTGGGSERQGLGFGIHWHIENPVYYYATDERQQDIPYVEVQNADGSKTQYLDTEAEFDPAAIKPGQLKQMDCITCHNRTAHLFPGADETMDDLLSRNLVSAKIPDIKKKGVEVLSAAYPNNQAANEGISSLVKYYQEQKAEFYASNKAQVDAAVQAIQDAYNRTHFPDQKVDPSTHPNNLAHTETAGCFRCHDGKHLLKAGGTSINPPSTIRLECNLCHSVPVVSGPNQLAANLQLSKGFEPDSHKGPNWINLHRTSFDQTCAGCHKTDDPGGSSNTSFCSNSMCHGATWKFAGFDAPNLRAILAEQAKSMVTPTPEAAAPTPTAVEEVIAGDEATPTAPASESASPTATEVVEAVTATPEAGGTGQSSAALTYDAAVGPMLTAKCGACHGSTAMKGLNVTTYATLMKGGDDGAVVVPGDPDNSKIVKVQTGSSPHFGQFSADEVKQLIQWIKDGAKEK